MSSPLSWTLIKHAESRIGESAPREARHPMRQLARAEDMAFSPPPPAAAPGQSPAAVLDSRVYEGEDIRQCVCAEQRTPESWCQGMHQGNIQPRPWAVDGVAGGFGHLGGPAMPPVRLLLSPRTPAGLVRHSNHDRRPTPTATNAAVVTQM